MKKIIGNIKNIIHNITDNLGYDFKITVFFMLFLSLLLIILSYSMYIIMGFLGLLIGTLASEIIVLITTLILVNN